MGTAPGGSAVETGLGGPEGRRDAERDKPTLHPKEAAEASPRRETQEGYRPLESPD
jgi:hypothetical protein